MCSFKGHKKIRNIRALHSARVSIPVADEVGEDECQQQALESSKLGILIKSRCVYLNVTGYSLTWDQIGYWVVKIVTGIPDAIPVIGSSVVELLRGSASVGQSTNFL